MAIAHAQTVNTGTTSSSSVTRSVAVGSGANRTLVAYVSWIDVGSTTTQVSSVVFNTSENFTFRVRSRYTIGSDCLGIEIWTLDNPSNASANVVATMSQSCNYLSIGVSEYTGANNGVGANTAAATGSSNNPAGSFTTASTDNKALWGTGGYVIGTSTPGGSETERLDVNNSGVQDYGIWEEAAAAGTSSISLTSTDSSYWSLAGIELKATSTGVTGTLAKTLADLTKAIAGTVLVEGGLAATLADLSKTIDGDVLVEGGLAATLADLSKTIEGDVLVDGELNQALADSTLVSAGTVGSVPVTGELDQTFEGVTCSIAGTVLVDGELAATLAGVTVSAAATVLVTGQLTAGLADISYSLSGKVAVEATLTQTLEGFGLSSAGVVGEIESIGTLDLTLADLSVSLFGAVAVVGELAATLADATLQASTAIMSGVLGTTEIHDSLTVKALPSNSGLVWIGKHSDDTISSSTGFELAAGDELTFLWVDNLAEIYVQKQVEADELCWIRLFV